MSNDCAHAAIASHKPVLLVVDNDEEVRKALNIALQQEGFDVWLASSGEEALEIYRHHYEWIEVFLIDLKMPGLSGLETLTALQSINPHLSSCFMTDDATNTNGSELPQHSATPVFQKPLDIANLSLALWQLVGNRSPRSGQAA